MNHVTKKKSLFIKIKEIIKKNMKITLNFR